MSLKSYKSLKISFLESITFIVLFPVPAQNYGTREGTYEFYVLICSDDLISCLQNLSSCSNNII